MAKWVVKNMQDYVAAKHVLARKAEDICQKVTFVTMQEFYGSCMNVLSRAVDLAPLDTGFLRSSGALMINGMVVATGDDSGGVSGLSVDVQNLKYINATIGFYAPYAFTQHEHVEYQHENGQALYLEIALDEILADLKQRMLERIQGIT